MTETLVANEQAMLEFGARMALQCVPPCVIFLYGPLGAGKTTLVRGFLHGLGYTGKVKSPSYSVVESYDVQGKSIVHFDFYRIQNPQELEFIGIADYWQPSSIFLIEWPENAAHLLPPANMKCYLEVVGEGRRVRVVV